MLVAVRNVKILVMLYNKKYVMYIFPTPCNGAYYYFYYEKVSGRRKW
jgi:hypothetical protein